MPDRAHAGQEAAGLTILENWILDRLDRTETLTPTQLAEQLAIPRPMIIDALIDLADRGLIGDASEDEPADDEPADEPAGLDGLDGDDDESPVSMHLNAVSPTV